MNGQKILIVEDEMITALDLSNQIRQLGYQVSALAKSGEEAVRLSEELMPDLVLMDVSLAGSMDGIEASERIQKAQRTPIVYLTAYPHVFLREPTQMRSPYVCLSKPYSAPALQAVLEMALQRS